MPSERNSSPNVERAPQEPQSKLCSSCQLPLDAASVTGLLLHPEYIVCGGCREKAAAQRDAALLTVDSRTLCLEMETDIERHHPLQAPDDLTLLYPTRLGSDERVLEHDTDMDAPSSPRISPPVSDSPYRTAPTSAVDVARNVTSRHSSPFDTDQLVPNTLSHPNYTPSDPIAIPHRTGYSPVSSPDPLTDITRLRVRSQTRGCLYPGASFQGTQKSGRNSYEVKVTIVDVDLSSSFLCGYLRIRGLTDDWPELTTFFDAEIIGNRYGFLTQNWGATEQEDMVHWSRFPAFRHVKNELKKPHLTMNDRDRGAVFMRWKERFLVPDHRVQDISGASFAGFYYVCVDFNPLPSAWSGAPETPTTLEQIYTNSTNVTMPLKVESTHVSRWDSDVRQGRPSPPAGCRATVPVATMNGFYFHQNSEPYQQLSLTHIPERTSSVFEFR